MEGGEVTLTRMRLIDLAEFLGDHKFREFTLEIDYLLKLTFQSVYVFFTPDVILFRNDNGNYVNLSEVYEIYLIDDEREIILRYIETNGLQRTARIILHP